MGLQRFLSSGGQSSLSRKDSFSYQTNVASIGKLLLCITLVIFTGKGASVLSWGMNLTLQTFLGSIGRPTRGQTRSNLL